MKLCLICWRSIDGDGWTVNGHGSFCSRSCLDRFTEAAGLLLLHVDTYHALADMLTKLLTERTER